MQCVTGSELAGGGGVMQCMRAVVKGRMAGLGAGNGNGEVGLVSHWPIGMCWRYPSTTILKEPTLGMEVYM